MRIIGFLCDITGITGKIEKTLDTMDKIETVFFRDVETERGKDATEEVAKKYEIILAEMTGKFKKIMEYSILVQYLLFYLIILKFQKIVYYQHIYFHFNKYSIVYSNIHHF